MKKRLSILVLSLIMVLSLAGCQTDEEPASSESSVSSESTETGNSTSEESEVEESSEESAEESDETKEGNAYTPGTYEATARGNNGDITVSVTFSENAIDNVEVVDHSETLQISDLAIEGYPEAIVENQTLDLDNITGATFTSSAIKNAVSNTIEQAGGDPANLNDMPDEEPEETEVTIDTEVVVLGAGGSGITAALRLDELGHDTVLVEKNAFLGGTITTSGGQQIVGGSELAAENGASPDDSADIMVEDFMNNGPPINQEDTLRMYAENVGETADWQVDYVGIEFDSETGLLNHAEYTYPRAMSYAGEAGVFSQTMADKVEESNIEVLTRTTAKNLIVEDGAVVGVLAEDEGGVQYTINADAVIMATGGYGNNEEIKSDQLNAALYYGPSWAKGEGLIMAVEDAGAGTVNLELGKSYPNGIEVSEGIAKSTIKGNTAALETGAILFTNPEGQRVVNEKGSNREILDAQLAQTDQTLFMLMDQETFDTWRNSLDGTGISQDDIDTWVENNGSETPYFYNADSLAELEELAGMDAGALSETVETFNSYVENGEDPDFNRPADYMVKGFEEGAGPFYLVEQKPRFATTLGGLYVNDSMEVLTEDGEAIPNLYAAGEVTGGVMGDDSPPGANNGWAVTSGKQAAESVAAQLGTSVEEE